MTRLSARDLIDAVTDRGTYQSWDVPADRRGCPPDYRAELERAGLRAGTDEAVLTGEGRIGGARVALLLSEFSFLAGSIGNATATRLLRAIERATAERLPLLAFPASGGTRMQEGTPAFVRMVAIANAVTAHKAAGLPYLVYLRHPTAGGVLASWGSLGQLTTAEPGALVGFLGPLVYEALYGEAFPEGVQRAENLDSRDGGRRRAARGPAAPACADILGVLCPPGRGDGRRADCRRAVGRREPDGDAWSSVVLTRRRDGPGWSSCCGTRPTTSSRFRHRAGETEDALLLSSPPSADSRLRRPRAGPGAQARCRPARPGRSAHRPPRACGWPPNCGLPLLRHRHPRRGASRRRRGRRTGRRNRPLHRRVVHARHPVGLPAARRGHRRRRRSPCCRRTACSPPGTPGSRRCRRRAPR